MLIEENNEENLVELGHVPTMRNYLADLWGRREFAVIVPFNDLRVENMNTRLGQLWHVINPIMQIAVYFIVFGLILDINRGDMDNYLAFLIVGVLLFTLSTRVLMASVRSLERDEGLIRSVQFPRALIPVTSVIEQTMGFVPAAGVLLVSLIMIGEYPNDRWLLFPFVLGFQFAINLGLSLITARAGFVVRDLSQIISHVIRMLFYFSGVIFDISRFADEVPKFVIPLFALNPFYDILVVARWSLIDGSAPGEAVFGFFAWALILPIVGMRYFVNAEHRYGS